MTRSSVWNIELRDDSPFYEVFSYPAGEVQLRIKKEYLDWAKGKVRIVSRDTSGNGLLRLGLLASAVYGLNPNVSLEVVFPYLPFGRADRVFVTGDCGGLATFASFVNALMADRVITLDAHSVVAGQFFKNFRDVPATPLIGKAIGRWAERHALSEVCVLFPDKGALERYRDVPDQIGPIKITKVYAEKQRDAVTGKLSGFRVPKFRGDYVLIVDDICDGGGTFLGIADVIHREPGIKLGLYVTHGIFSQGFEKLHAAFDAIYTTDSVKDVSTLDAAVFNAEAECRT